MKVTMSIVLFLIFTTFNNLLLAKDNCNEIKCPNYAITSHYRDLDCKPTVLDDDCCPVKYDCPVLEQIKSNIDKCYFNNKEYSSGDRLPGTDTAPLCSAGCRCSTRSGPATFICALIECPPFFNILPKSGCYFEHSLNDCCSINEKCPTSETPIEKVSCTVDGQSYKPGQKIYPESDTCSACICKIDGTLDCHSINCGALLHNARELAANYGVKFYGKKHCCPIGYVEPAENDSVIASKPSDHTDVGQCKFGNLTLNIGDQVDLGNKIDCTKCECLVPPLVTCIQDSDCDI